MAGKPIDKEYLITSLKKFDEKFLSQKYSQGSGSGEFSDLTNYYTKTEVDEELAIKADLSSIPDVSNLASTEYVDNAVKNVEVDLTGYVKTEDLHTHENKAVLDKLTESEDGKLLFDGEEIQGSTGIQGID